MAAFFPDRPGLAVFLNAGDPPLDVLRDVVQMLDERGVDCLELAVPFPDSPTDGPVIRRSANRALDGGVGLDETLAFVASARGALRRLRIAVLADWGYTVRPRTVERFVTDVVSSGADGALLHGVPPTRRLAYYELAAAAGLPIVTTCYGSSWPALQREAAHHASAYVYLVAHYGRSGSAAAHDIDALAATIATLREQTAAPVAVGFGVRTRADVARIHGIGADAAIVGTALVDRVEAALAAGADPVEEFAAAVTALHPDVPTTTNPRTLTGATT